MSTVSKEVIEVVKAWARARGDDSTKALLDGRLRLEPALVPTLVSEIAEITAEQLVFALDMPSQPAVGEKPVPFLGLQLSQAQGTRTAQWLDDQQDLARALGLTLDGWSEKLMAGFAQVVAKLQGKDLTGTGAAVAAQFTGDGLAQAARGFQGAVDVTKSDKAGLRGILAARTFKKE